MNILGIETSCDETAASVVQDGCFVLSNIITSSLKEHAKYGGIIPEIASRRQLECINPVVDTALKKAGLTLKEIDAIAVTQSPGLIGSLLVGTSFARSLAFAIQKPLIPVNHIEAHLYANFLINRKTRVRHSEPAERAKNLTKRSFPFAKLRVRTTNQLPRLPVVGLVVSGGHSALYSIKNFSHFELIGRTRDDAAGEAFDKVARILALGYPGGPAIDKLAQQVKSTPVTFPCATLPGTNDFSFSGIKTAVLNYTRNRDGRSTATQAQICRAFQRSVVSVLVEKSMLCCEKCKSKTLVIGGGVAANSYLRAELFKSAKEHSIKVFIPEFEFCLDNAAMIAGLGYHLKKNGADHVS